MRYREDVLPSKPRRCRCGREFLPRLLDRRDPKCRQVTDECEGCRGYRRGRRIGR